MKKTLLAAVVVAGLGVFAQQLSLTDAKAKISEVIAEPAKMTGVMKQLSSESQVKFLAAVNKAIADMPGSKADQAATFLAVDAAAIKGAQKGNVAKLVAECFATASIEALPTLTEGLAPMFNRDSSKYSEQEFIKIAQNTMGSVNERTAQVDYSEVRSGFAALMFIHASNTTGDSLDAVVKGLVEALPPSTRVRANDQWFPAALGTKDGGAADYDPILAAADVFEEVRVERGLLVAGPQFHEVMIADTLGSLEDLSAFSNERTVITDVIYNKDHLPTLNGGLNAPVGAGGEGGSIVTPTPKPPEPPEPPEPQPYPNQNF